MKPKRPTETDLLALVQNGFNAQLPKDRAAQAPAREREPQPKGNDTAAADPPPLVPMVRITLTIPEELRYRLKMTLMNQRRTARSKMTQDEFGSRAIAALLEEFEKPSKPASREERLAAFLQECLREKALSKAWAPKAKHLLDGENGDPRTDEEARELPGSSESREHAS
jgi:hypothetical protein